MGITSDAEWRARLEARLDRLTDAVTQLVRVEERQVNQGTALERVAGRMEVMEKILQATVIKVDTWVARGVTVWAVVVVAWTLYTSWPR